MSGLGFGLRPKILALALELKPETIALALLSKAGAHGGNTLLLFKSKQLEKYLKTSKVYRNYSSKCSKTANRLIAGDTSRLRKHGFSLLRITCREGGNRPILHKH